MTTTHVLRYTAAPEGGYNVGHVPTLAAIAAGTDADSGRHLGTVRKIARDDWSATTPTGFPLGDRYYTRDEAAQALLVTADRLAQLEATAAAAEPVLGEDDCARCGQHVSLGGAIDTVDGHLAHGWDCLAEPVEHVAPSARAEAAQIGVVLGDPVTPEQREAFRRTATRRRPVVELDVPPTDEERVTVRIRASELRPGDLVVDSLGEHQYAAFDVDTADHGGGLLPHLVTVWTAIRDQERGLPTRLNVPADREVLVSRPLSAEGRELLAALDRS